MMDGLQNGRIHELLKNGRAKQPAKKTSATPYHKTNKRDFVSAKINRLTSDWPSTNISADEEVYRSLRVLRARSRWLYKNNGYYKRYVSMTLDNVIGWQGIRIEAKIRGRRGTAFDTKVNTEIERAWKRWNKKGNISTREQINGVDLQRLILSGVVVDGEVFLRKRYGVDNGFGYALEIIDPMRVPLDYTHQRAKNGNEIINGIEYANGEAVAYYVVPPGMRYDYDAGQAERVDAKNILHLFVPELPEQKRGLPMLSAGMQKLHMTDKYEMAVVAQARIAAEKGGFFSKGVADDGFAGNGEDEEEVEMMDSEIGSFGILPQGWQFNQFDPQHPSNALDPFMTKLLRGVASAGNVNYNSLANDLSDVNYSSARIGALEVRSHWRYLQQWMIEWYLEDVYKDWLRMALSSGAIDLPLSRYNDYLDVSWVPRSWQWVDPQKEAIGYRSQVRMGTMSLSDVASEQGRDFADTAERLAKDKEVAEKHGLKLMDVFPVLQQTNASKI